MNNLSSYSTKDIVEELRSRNGVETKTAEPYQDLKVEVTGPAIVIVITD